MILFQKLVIIFSVSTLSIHIHFPNSHSTGMAVVFQVFWNAGIPHNKSHATDKYSQYWSFSFRWSLFFSETRARKKNVDKINYIVLYCSFLR